MEVLQKLGYDVVIDNSFEPDQDPHDIPSHILIPQASAHKVKSVESEGFDTSNPNIFKQSATLPPRPDTRNAFEKWADTDMDPIEDEDISTFDFSRHVGPVVMRLFHGSISQIEAFNQAGIIGTLNGFLGRVNYFSSSEKDVSDNYAGGGPDREADIVNDAGALNTILTDALDAVADLQDTGATVEQVIERYAAAIELIENDQSIPRRFREAPWDLLDLEYHANAFDLDKHNEGVGFVYDDFADRASSEIVGYMYDDYDNADPLENVQIEAYVRTENPLVVSYTDGRRMKYELGFDTSVVWNDLWARAREQLEAEGELPGGTARRVQELTAELDLPLIDKIREVVKQYDDIEPEQVVFNFLRAIHNETSNTWGQQDWLDASSVNHTLLFQALGRVGGGSFEGEGASADIHGALIEALGVRCGGREERGGPL